MALAIGCATLGGENEREPGRLRAEADALLEAGDGEAAYYKLVALYTKHPESRHAREVFPAAAQIFKGYWWRNRHTNPESDWVVNQPDVLFAWFASLADGEFPEREFEALMLGMPFGFYRRYETFAASEPALSAWRIDVVKDNGIIERVTPIAVE